MPRLRGSALVVLQKDSRDKASMLQQLFDEIYIKDILRRPGVRKKEELETIRFMFIPPFLINPVC